MNECVDEVAVVNCAGDELLPVDFRLRCAIACLHAFDGKSLFVLAQAAGSAWRVWKEEVDNDRKEDSRSALDDEQQAPWLDRTFDVRNAIGKSAGKTVG